MGYTFLFTLVESISYTLFLSVQAKIFLCQQVNKRYQHFIDGYIVQTMAT